MNFERYRLILYHDMIINDDVIPLDDPITTQYIVAMPKRSTVSVPVVVNEMIERLKGYMINSLEQDAEQTKKV